MKNSEDEAIHMSTTPQKEELWRDGKDAYIPIKDMTDVHLQRAKLKAQKNEFKHFKACLVFAKIAESLDTEANLRGIELKEYNSEYFKNAQVLKKSIKNAN